MEIKFVTYDATFLSHSWIWLNDFEIKNLIMAPDITKKEQRDWFKSLEHREDYYIWGITADDHMIGAVGMKHVNFETKTGEYFGYIGEKEYWGCKIGQMMVEYILKFAKENGLRKVYLNVSKSNFRAIRLYQRLGFIPDTDKCDSDIGKYYILI